MFNQFKCISLSTSYTVGYNNCIYSFRQVNNIFCCFTVTPFISERSYSSGYGNINRSVIFAITAYIINLSADNNFRAHYQIQPDSIATFLFACYNIVVGSRFSISFPVSVSPGKLITSRFSYFNN